MKVYTVHLNLVTKTGATFQIPVLSCEQEADAKLEAQKAQNNMTIASRAQLYMPLPDGELDDMKMTLGGMFAELGIKSFAHSISWTDTSLLEVPDSRVKLH